MGSKLNVEHDGTLGRWTKVGQIFSSNFPQLPPASPEGIRAIRKTLLDTLWNAKLVDILDRFGWDTKETFGRTIDQLTIQQVEDRKRVQLAERWSPERTKRREFAIVLRDHYQQHFADQTERLRTELALEQRGIDTQKLDRGLLVAAYRDFGANQLGRNLPSAVIPTELYCLYERDASRRLRDNDWDDWQHAAAALPYCDFFLTERHLAHQLTNVLDMGTRYGCAVAGTIQEANRLMMSIA